MSAAKNSSLKAVIRPGNAEYAGMISRLFGIEMVSLYSIHIFTVRKIPFDTPGTIDEIGVGVPQEEV